MIAKPGLDGHDVGAKLVCRALMEAGMEVIYTGLRQSPEAIARAAVQEGADAVGLSVLSGAHVPLARAVIDKLREMGAGDIPVVVGGNIPPQDRETMKALGVAAVFPTDTPFEEIINYFQKAATT